MTRRYPVTNRSRFVARILGTVAAALSVASASAAPPPLALSDAYVRFILPSRPAAGYFTLTNNSEKAQVLDGVDSSACGMLMLHRSVREGGVERMTMVDSVAIPAHGALAFAPGGYHLMCVQPTAAVVPGKKIAITLHFQDGSELTADFPVRSMKDE